jgi:ligand-binding SRPBCC domain-containing protein
MRYTFHAEQWVRYPVELVFAFFANPQNLPKLLPPWQKARMEEARIAPPPQRPEAADPARRFRSIAAGEGTELTISFRPFPFSPIRIPWEGVITEFAWNQYFSDEIRRGPLQYWRHCHRFSEQARDGAAGTQVTDDIEYELAFQAGGGVVNSMFFAPQLRRVFAYRQKRLEEILAIVSNHMRRISGGTTGKQ